MERGRIVRFHLGMQTAGTTLNAKDEAGVVVPAAPRTPSHVSPLRITSALVSGTRCPA